MFVILLRFSANKAGASQFMDAHNQWIQRGMEDGVFLVVGSLESRAGGAIIAHGAPRSEVEALVANDPFVREKVVEAEIHEITPGSTDPRLGFLLA